MPISEGTGWVTLAEVERKPGWLLVSSDYAHMWVRDRGLFKSRGVVKMPLRRARKLSLEDGAT